MVMMQGDEREQSADMRTGRQRGCVRVGGGEVTMIDSRTTRRGGRFVKRRVMKEGGGAEWG